MNGSKATTSERGAELPPPLELECLTALWRLGRANVKQVQDALAPNRALAYTTVMTLLERLARKGYLAREKQGRSFQYRPLVARESVQRAAVLQLVNRLFDGSDEELAAFLSGSRTESEHPDASSHRAAASSLDAALL